MDALHDMPNIGAAVEALLIKAGVDSPGKLIELGSKEAFIKIRLVDGTACLNMLYALEGAVQGIRWHHLSDTKKQELKAFYKSL